MKKIIVCLFFSFALCKCWSQTIDSTMSHTDSLNIQLINFITDNKAVYIGQPLSKLYTDIYQPIRFSLPDNLGSRRGAGTTFYQNFLIYLPRVDGDLICGFFVSIATKVYLPVKTYIEKGKIRESDSYVKELLKNAVITTIEKRY